MQQPDDKAKPTQEEGGIADKVFTWALSALLVAMILIMLGVFAAKEASRGLTVETAVTTAVAPACPTGETHTTFKFNIRLGR